MPHAALWVVQQVTDYDLNRFLEVSMPHAALLVVQHAATDRRLWTDSGFNAARGFVGGAAVRVVQMLLHQGFNAARGFVGGAAAPPTSPRKRLGRFNAARGFVGGAASGKKMICW